MDIYKEVTDRIVAEMEKGIIPWEKPWIASGNCVAHTTGKPYSILNQMLLGRPGEYITFNQCQKEGGKVKKGAKAQMVVFWKWIEQEDEETGEKKEIPFLRYYNVFHIDQCEGISARHTKPLHMPDGAEAIEEAQEIIYGYLERENVKLLHQEGDRAFYRPSTDEVVLPIRKQFAVDYSFQFTLLNSTEAFLKSVIVLIQQSSCDDIGIPMRNEIDKLIAAIVFISNLCHSCQVRQGATLLFPLLSKRSWRTVLYSGVLSWEAFLAKEAVMVRALVIAS